MRLVDEFEGALLGDRTEGRAEIGHREDLANGVRLDLRGCTRHDRRKAEKHAGGGFAGGGVRRLGSAHRAANIRESPVVFLPAVPIPE
ncbi:MAG: hypothetical protein ACK4KW_05405 [Gemmobacter sp.]